MMATHLSEKLEKIAKGSNDSAVLYFFIERREKKNTAVDVLCGLLICLLKARRHSDELTQYLYDEYAVQKEALFSKDAIEALWRVFVAMITDPIAGQVYCIIDGLDYCTDETLRRLLIRITNFFGEQPQAEEDARDGARSHNPQTPVVSNAQRRLEQRQKAGLKMMLISREKPEIVEHLSEFAHIDMSTRKGPYDKRRRTLASVVADVVRQQKLERSFSNSFGDQQTIDLDTADPTTTALLEERSSSPFQAALLHETSTTEHGNTYPQQFQFTDCVVNGSRTAAHPTAQVQGSAPPLPPRPHSQDDGLSCDRTGVSSTHAEDTSLENGYGEQDYGDQALHLYIKARVEQLIHERHWLAVIQRSFIADLRQRGDGTFLWVDFALQEVENRATGIHDIVKVLSVLPSTLTEMYAFVLDRIPPKLTNIVAGLLRWSVCAREPLNLQELTIALNLTGYQRDSARQLLLSAVSSCGNMITINTDDDTVNIVHSSLTEFLSQESSSIHWQPRLAPYIVRPSSTHSDIANACISYLEGGCFNEGPISAAVDQDSYNERLEQFPFMAYASTYWLSHLLNTKTPYIDLASPFFQSKSKIRKSWWESYWTVKTGDEILLAPKNFTLLHLAAYFDLVCIAQQLHQHGELRSRIDRQDSHGYTPLQYSVIEGNIQMFDFLIGMGATQNSSAETLLELACRKGQPDIAETLLNRGSDVNARARNRTVKETTYKMTKFLPGTMVEGDVGYNLLIRDLGDHETPLVIAAFSGHSAVINLLLSRGAFIDAATDKGFTSLHAASYQGHVECVEILLERGASGWVKTTDQWLPLHFAALRGSLPVIKIFLNMGVLLESATVKLKTALHLAAYGGHAEVIRFLVNHGADLETKSHKGETPLHLATRSAKPQAVETLLSLGANKHAVTHDGKTPRKMVSSWRSAASKECLRILKTFGMDNYRPWKPPAEPDSEAADAVSVADTDVTVDSIPGPLWNTSAESILHHESSTSLPLNMHLGDNSNTGSALDLHIEHPSYLTGDSIPPPQPQSNHDTIQTQSARATVASVHQPVLSRVWSEPAPASPRDTHTSMQNFQARHYQRSYASPVASLATPATIHASSNVGKNLSSEITPASWSDSNPWQTPTQAHLLNASHHMPAKAQDRSDKPVINAPIASRVSRTSVVGMINSMSLSTPPPAGPQAHLTHHVATGQPAMSQPTTQFSHNGQFGSHTPVPAHTPIPSISLPSHPATAPATTPFLPPMPPSPAPQLYQNPHQAFSQHRSQTVPMIQPPQPYQHPPQLYQPTYATSPHLATQPHQTYSPPQQPYASPPQPYSPSVVQSSEFSGNSTASTYNATYEYNAPPVTQPYNPGLGINGNGLLFAPPPTQDHSLKKRKSFLGGLMG